MPIASDGNVTPCLYAPPGRSVPGFAATLRMIATQKAIEYDPRLGGDSVKLQQGSGPNSAAAQHREQPAGLAQALLQTGWLPGLHASLCCLA